MQPVEGVDPAWSGLQQTLTKLLHFPQFKAVRLVNTGIALRRPNFFIEGHCAKYFRI